jgi:hypothetical protein
MAARSDSTYPPKTVVTSRGIRFCLQAAMCHCLSSYIQCQYHRRWSWNWSYFTTDSPSASLSWCQVPIWDQRPIFSFTLKFPLRVCSFVAPSLTRGRFCNLLYNCLCALPEQSLLGRSPTELMTIFYCLFLDFPNLEGQVPVFISPSNSVAQICPRALGSLFVVSYDSQGLRWRYSVC